MYVNMEVDSEMVCLLWGTPNPHRTSEILITPEKPLMQLISPWLLLERGAIAMCAEGCSCVLSRGCLAAKQRGGPAV
jgi:hypothetical protein